jgi:hypothetical protein
VLGSSLLSLLLLDHSAYGAPEPTQFGRCWLISFAIDQMRIGMTTYL